MCGFAGVVAGSGGELDRRRLRAVVEAMSVTLVHRGPDDAGTWIDERSEIGLGHRRLTILDLSAAGHQPMVSSCGRWVIAYNGEIYELDELRAAVEGRGRRLRGRSDTEVLLEAIAEWGVRSAVERLVGMFAFAAWDVERRELHLVRDRLGKKPLYCGWAGSDLVFASELKAIRAHPAFAAEIDRAALTLYLRFGYVPGPFSIYRGVSKLPQGTIASIRLDELRPGLDVARQAQPYWSALEVAEAAAADPLRATDAEAVERLDALLRRAVRTRMYADVPLGVFLSGGIDSATVTGMLQAESATPIRTFSLGFEARPGGEEQRAAQIAARLGAVHTGYRVGASDLLATIPRMPALFDEPFSDSSQIPTYIIARLARQEVTVALTGDGGDELFHGYRRYYRGAKLWQHLERTPRPLRSALAGVVGALSRLGRGENRLVGLAADLDADSVGEMFRNRVSRWSEPAAAVTGGSEPPTPFDTVAATTAIAEPAQHMMLLDLATYLTDDILVKVDRATMAVSLEARCPLLDHRVVEFALRLPLALKLRDGRGKWILRQVLARYVPPELTERPKQGFGAPVRAWLTGPLKEWAASRLDRQLLRRQGYLDAALVERMWRDCLAGRRETHQYVWDVLMFQVWLAG